MPVTDGSSMNQTMPVTDGSRMNQTMPAMDDTHTNQAVPASDRAASRRSVPGQEERTRDQTITMPLNDNMMSNRELNGRKKAFEEGRTYVEENEMTSTCVTDAAGYPCVGMSRVLPWQDTVVTEPMMKEYLRD